MGVARCSLGYMLVWFPALTASIPKSGPNCFVPLSRALDSPPFEDDEVKLMVRYFVQNLDVNGSGAVLAARGEVPALPHGCCPGGYAWDWMRDAALSMTILQRLVGEAGEVPAGVPRVTAAYVHRTLSSYAAWVDRVQKQQGLHRHTEPKWDIATATPYRGSWCRPQTDGPGLRAQALMRFATGLGHADRHALWALIRFDLDWLAQGPAAGMASCDIWEETVDGKFLWNRATMRAALVAGSKFAESIMKDHNAASRYLNAADDLIGDPVFGHLQMADGGGFLTECPAQGSSPDCTRLGKNIDGSVILSLVHSELVSATSLASARTIRVYNAAFCSAYPVNLQDSAAKVPGILYGRYVADVYGGGNPWVLITAALASLMYQAARSVSSGPPLSAEELQAWQAALALDTFNGSAVGFVAAGDAVLLRLRHHVKSTGFHLYEQIDKVSGKQYNAKDLTWSYAEVLGALQERFRTLESLGVVFM